jgi:hypothetical protein
LIVAAAVRVAFLLSSIGGILTRFKPSVYFGWIGFSTTPPVAGAHYGASRAVFIAWITTLRLAAAAPFHARGSTGAAAAAAACATAVLFYGETSIDLSFRVFSAGAAIKKRPFP